MDIKKILDYNNRCLELDRKYSKEYMHLKELTEKVSLKQKKYYELCDKLDELYSIGK